MAVTDYADSGRASWSDNLADQYVGIQGRLTSSSSEADVAQEMFRDGAAANMRVRVVSSSPSGAVTVTLMKNGSATGLAVTISANTSAAVAENSTSVSFSAGDTLSWRIDLPSSGPTNPPDTTLIQSIACEIGV